MKQNLRQIPSNSLQIRLAIWSGGIVLITGLTLLIFYTREVIFPETIKAESVLEAGQNWKSEISNSVFSDKIEIQLNSGYKSLLVLKLYQGKELKKKEVVNVATGANTVQMKFLNELPQGNYKLEVSGEDKSEFWELEKK